MDLLNELLHRVLIYLLLLEFCSDRFLNTSARLQNVKIGISEWKASSFGTNGICCGIMQEESYSLRFLSPSMFFVMGFSSLLSLFLFHFGWRISSQLRLFHAGRKFISFLFYISFISLKRYNWCDWLFPFGCIITCEHIVRDFMEGYDYLKLYNIFY